MKVVDETDDDDDATRFCSGRWGSSPDDDDTNAGTPSELSGVIGSRGGTGAGSSSGLPDADDGSQTIHAQLQWIGPHMAQ